MLDRRPQKKLKGDPIHRQLYLAHKHTNKYLLDLGKI